MTEVYKALLQLRCEWTAVSSYRLKCRWRPNAVQMPQHHLLDTLARQPSGGPEYIHALQRQASSRDRKHLLAEFGRTVSSTSSRRLSGDHVSTCKSWGKSEESNWPGIA